MFSYLFWPDAFSCFKFQLVRGFLRSIIQSSCQNLLFYFMHTWFRLFWFLIILIKELIAIKWIWHFRMNSFRIFVLLRLRCMNKIVDNIIRQIWQHPLFNLCTHWTTSTWIVLVALHKIPFTTYYKAFLSQIEWVYLVLYTIPIYIKYFMERRYVLVDQVSD